MGKTLVIKDADFSDVAVEKRTVLYSRSGSISGGGVNTGVSLLAQSKATMFVTLKNPTKDSNNRALFVESNSDNSFGKGLQCVVNTTAQDVYVYLGANIEPSSNNKRSFNKKVVIVKNEGVLNLVTDLSDSPSSVQASKFGSTHRNLFVGGWDPNIPVSGVNLADYDLTAESLDVVIYEGIIDYSAFLSD